MSSGQTHDRITLWSLPVVMMASLWVTLNIWLTAWVCLGFLMGGLLLGPDLDIHSVQYKRWGWLRWIWLPYRGSMRHRSFWSHGPIIGTTVRVLYASCWLAMGGIVVVDALNSLQRTALTWGDLGTGLSWSIHTYWQVGLALLVGLELGALSHYTTDWLSSFWKRKGTTRKKTTRSKTQPKRRS